MSTASPKKPRAKKSAAVVKPASKPDKKIEMQLRHSFTPAESIEIAKKMAEAIRELNQAEEEKKAVTYKPPDEVSEPKQKNANARRGAHHGITRKVETEVSI